MLIDVDKELDKYDAAAIGIKVMAPDYSLKPLEETDNVVVADNTATSAVQSDAIPFARAPTNVKDVIAEKSIPFARAPTNVKDVIAEKYLETLSTQKDYADNTATSAVQSDAIDDTQESSFVAGVVEDTPKAIIQGVVEGSKNFNDFMGILAGAPGDALNYLGKNFTGREDFKSWLPGSKDINRQLQAVLSWLDENIMPDMGFNEYANKPFNYEKYGEIIKIFSQFATPGIPAAKVVKATKIIEKLLGKANLWVEGMKAPNPFIRSLVWGTFADAAAFPETAGSLTDMLTKYLLGQTPEERSEFGNVVVSIFEKNVNDPAIVNRLRTSVDGLFIAAGVEIFVRTLIKGSKLIPWKELLDKIKKNPTEVKPSVPREMEKSWL